jgi:plastocyanin
LSSDARIRRRAAPILAALTAVLCHTAVVHAQGGVSGQISLIERQGADPSDPASAVVYLEVRGRVEPMETPRGAPRQATIAMTGREFVPHVRTILAGGSVAFPNKDPFSHNVFSNAEAGPFDLNLYRRGVSRAQTFVRPGIYPIYCNIHSRMVSFVIAVPTPYVATVASDGRFMIPDVPAGTYVLHAWHEHAGGPVTREIVVPATGLAGQHVVLDARAYVAGPHLNKFGLPYAATRADRY